MAGDVRLDYGGVGAVMKSGAVQALVAQVAEEIAGNVRGQGIMVDDVPGTVPLPVEVTTTTTDRAHASVAITHPSGTAVQAKHGALTRAASAAGVSVSG